MSFPRQRPWAMLFLVTAVYTAAGKFGLMLASLHPSASPVWPPTGIAFAALLLCGMRVWPAVFAGAFLVNVTTAGTIASSLGIAAGNTLEGIAGCFLLRYAFGGVRPFERVQGVAVFAFLSAGVATMVSATIGTASLFLGGLVARGSLFPVWLTWWLGDVTGALTITPLIMLWARHPRIRWDMRQWAEAVLLLLCTVLIGVVSFSDLPVGMVRQYPFMYVVLLPILWAGIRFTSRETITLSFILSCISIAATVRGEGPFAVESLNTSLLLLQSFLGIVTVTGLCVAAALHERLLLQESLEQNVARRTQELEMAREQDRASLQRLRATILHLPMAALLTDETRVLELNDAYCQMFHIGRTPELAKSMTADELFSRFMTILAHPEEHTRAVHRMLTDGNPQLNEEIHLHDGRIIVCDYIPIQDGGQKRGRLFLYRDVTRERRIDRAKSEFMSLASHQLRTPLTVLRWSLNRLAKDQPHMDAVHGKLFAEAREAANRMSDTINTMLKIARMETGAADLHIATFDLCVLLRECEQPYRGLREAKRQSFSLQCAEPLLITTDKTFLREIIGNLLQNAVKYTPDTGAISVSAHVESGMLTVRVEDTGYGIPADQQQHVFQKFFRGDNVLELDTSGTGLGLYLVSLMVNVLRGTIAVESQEGRGTTFTLQLPVSAGR